MTAVITPPETASDDTAPVALETPAVVVAQRDGTVVAQNPHAKQLMGAGTGRPCWEVVPGLDGAEGLPCQKGCVGELLRHGIEQSQQAHVRVTGRHHSLTCVPLGDTAVCLLTAAAAADPEPWELLTGRERNVLQLLADGETTASAARKLGVSGSTVRTHVENMRSKLGAKTRAALVAFGFRFGFLG
jgi:DNA-binding CsgD family transcriptional regulator